MPSILSGLSGSFSAGRERKVRRLAGERAQSNKDRSFAFDLAKQSQTVLNSAEDEVTKLNTFMASDTWEPGMASEALRRATAIDRAYGKVLGESAVGRVMKALHMDRDKTKKYDPTPGSRTARARASSPDDVATETSPRNPLYGWFGRQQKLDSEKKRRESLTDKEAGDIRMAVADHVSKNAIDASGELAFEKIPMLLMEQETSLIKAGYGRETVDSIMDDINEAYGEAAEGYAKVSGLEKEYKSDQNAASTRTSTFIGKMLGRNPDDFALIMAGGMPGGDSGAAKLHLKMEQAGQRMVANGFSDATIKWRLLAMYKENGSLPTISGGNAPWYESFLDAPQEAMTRWERYVSETPDAELSTKPVWDAESEMLAIQNLDFNPGLPPSEANWEFIPLWTEPGVARPALSGPPAPSGPREEKVRTAKVPGEDENRYINVPDKIKELLGKFAPKIERTGR